MNVAKREVVNGYPNGSLLIHIPEDDGGVVLGLLITRQIATEIAK